MSQHRCSTERSSFCRLWSFDDLCHSISDRLCLNLAFNKISSCILILWSKYYLQKSFMLSFRSLQWLSLWNLLECFFSASECSEAKLSFSWAADLLLSQFLVLLTLVLESDIIKLRLHALLICITALMLSLKRFQSSYVWLSWEADHCKVIKTLSWLFSYSEALRLFLRVCILH